MIERQKRLNEVYEHLRKHFGIHTQKDFAVALKYSRSVISAALNGKEDYLTDKLFTNICEAYPGTFNLDYLLTGKGQLLTIEEDVTIEDIEKQNNLSQPSSYADKIITLLEKQVKDKDEQLADKDRIIKLLEQKIEVLEAMQHIDAENPLINYPFPIGAADKNDVKARNASPYKTSDS